MGILRIETDPARTWHGQLIGLFAKRRMAESCQPD
ncbi:hypothetical protein SAJA_04780 [Salinisphaera japonica YTM-1]|uniref:Uncharacterized protein n=1 Tax=Salinisphaera japonica YTM-1 TaxID=1209778 RepID=A0A423PYS8_9GAMM|nr:hypothetical protein SAJA_04780 [Salinisphaera japonica YTM-1]